MKSNETIGFSRYERNGIILLGFLIIAAILLKNQVVSYWVGDTNSLKENDKEQIALLQQQINDAKESYTTKYSTEKKQYSNTNSTNAYGAIKPQYDDFKIEINSATEEEFDKLKGIGKVFSARIVTFRNKLGGFYSIEQLKDVYGIEDSVFQKFKKNLRIKPIKPKKININDASFEELTANPYFFTTVAKQIIGYRTKVRPFESSEDLKNLYFVKDHPEHYNKMLPYATVE